MFTLHTECGTLKWIQSFESSDGEMARWLEMLQKYYFVVVHRKGEKHLNAMPYHGSLGHNGVKHMMVTV